MTILLDHLKKLHPHLEKEAMEAGTLNGQILTLPDSWINLIRPVPPACPIEQRHPPSVVKMATNLATASAKWMAAGAPVVPDDVYQTRRLICQGCPEWDKEAWAGSGRCKLCGCGKLKLQWATEACPIRKWLTWVQPGCRTTAA